MSGAVARILPFSVFVLQGCSGGTAVHTEVVERLVAPDGLAIVEVVDYWGGGAAGFAGTYVYLDSVPPSGKRTLVADISGSDPTRRGGPARSVRVAWTDRRRCKLTVRGSGLRTEDSTPAVPRRETGPDEDGSRDFVFFELDVQ
jgi:hypothetical protein